MLVAASLWLDKELDNDSFIGTIKNGDIVIVCQSQKNLPQKYQQSKTDAAVEIVVSQLAATVILKSSIIFWGSPCNSLKNPRGHVDSHWDGELFS